MATAELVMHCTVWNITCGFLVRLPDVLFGVGDVRCNEVPVS